MNLQGWFPLELTIWSACSPRVSQVSSPAPQFKSITCLVLSPLYGPTLTTVHDCWKAMALTMWTIVIKVISLLFNTLYRFVIAFLTRRNCLFISWLQSPSAMILEPKKIKSVTLSTFFHLSAMKRWDQKKKCKKKKKKKKCKKAKWLSEEALQVAVKEGKWKAKEKRKDISIWMQSSKE